MRRNLNTVNAWSLLPHESSIWLSREEKTEYFMACRNDLFSFDEETPLVPVSGNLTLQVKLLHGV